MSDAHQPQVTIVLGSIAHLLTIPAARRSSLFATYIDAAPGSTINLPCTTVRPETLACAIQYLDAVEDGSLSEHVPDKIDHDSIYDVFDKSQVDYLMGMMATERALGVGKFELRLEVLFLANYLDIKPLHALMSLALACELRFLTPAQICEAFGAPRPTTADIERVCKEYDDVVGEFVWSPPSADQCKGE